MSMDDKRLAVLKKIKSEPKVVDLKLTFYMAACDSMSEKGSGTLVPSPKEYLRQKPMKEALLEANESIPNLRLLRLYLEHPDTFKMPPDTLSVLYWLLIRLKEPCLLSLDDPDDWPSIGIGDDEGDMSRPDMVFKVCYSTMSTRYIQWRSQTAGRKTMYAYTAVRLQDIHSSLHCGLHRQANSGGLGYGLSLCSKLTGCLPNLKPAWTWGKSCLGTKMAVVMVVQFADSTHKVMRLSRHQSTFYLISDPSYARIRYLLIWIKAPPARLPKIKQAGTDNRNNMRFLFSSLVLVSSLFLPKEPPAFLQNGLYSLTALGEKLLRHH